MNFRIINESILKPFGSRLFRIKAARAVESDEVVTKGQIESGTLDIVIDDITLDVATVGVGTAAAPSVTFTGDTDTGVYHPAANQVGITNAGTGQVIFTDGTIQPVTDNDIDLGTASKEFKNFYLQGDAASTSTTEATALGAGAINTLGGIYAAKKIINASSIEAGTALSYTTTLTQGLTTGITAFAGGGQASATALTTTLNNVTTCATAGDSVKLMAAVAGLTVTVKNSGATALDIFPATGDSIDALAVNLAVRIAPLSVATFRAIDATVWESNVDSVLTLVAPTTNTGQLVLQAAASAGNTQTTITNASQAAARTYTIPDAGGNASFVMTSSVGSVTGARCTAQFNATSGDTGTTLTAVTGMSVSVIAGATYTVDVYVGGTSTANSGMKLALAGTATWTSTDATAAYYTASAVAVGHNATATPGTAIGGTTAANIYATIKATIVVNAAGTLILQAAQNASHVDTTSVYVNSYINATRIA